MPFGLILKIEGVPMLQEPNVLFQADPKVVDHWTKALLLSLLFGAGATTLFEDMRSFSGFVRCTTLALISGYIVGGLCDAYGLKDGYTQALCGFSGLFANYLFRFIIQFLKYLMNNPQDLFGMILDRLLSAFGYRKNNKEGE